MGSVFCADFAGKEKAALASGFRILLGRIVLSA